MDSHRLGSFPEFRLVLMILPRDAMRNECGLCQLRSQNFFSIEAKKFLPEVRNLQGRERRSGSWGGCSHPLPTSKRLCGAL